MTLPALAEEVVTAYLRAVDDEAPGLVEGLYLEGSVALGDFRPRTSDIDFVAVTATPPEGAATAALERVHERLLAHRPRPFFDGVYLTWDDLRRGPDITGPRPRCHEGRFHPGTDGTAPAGPVTWRTLAGHGTTLRGPEPAGLDLWHDPRALAVWTDDNLDRYWRRLCDRASRPFGLWGQAALGGYGTVWIVTGVTRLHFTLATGDITSKEGACRHALEAFPPRWHRVVEEALRIRRADRALPTLTGLLGDMTEFLPSGSGRERRSLYRTPWARRRDVLAFAGTVIADAHRLHAGRPG
ncbi:nucleotidyltransferase domain-containing protein [Streptosporangium longisporum]